MELHTEFLSLLLERKRNASTERQKSNNFLICSIGDILVKQVRQGEEEGVCVRDSGK